MNEINERNVTRSTKGRKGIRTKIAAVGRCCSQGGTKWSAIDNGCKITTFLKLPFDDLLQLKNN